MKTKISTSISFALLIAILLAFVPAQEKDPIIDENFAVAAAQYERMLAISKDMTKYPRGGAKDGTLRYVGIGDWTGGFWPGALWYMYEHTKEQKWRTAAEKWTASLEKNQYNTKHHDIGFMMFNSYGNGLRLTNNESYKPILIQSAKSLVKRYSPVVGSIQSWSPRKNRDGNQWDFPVIIDNMMNLELLFWASKVTGDMSYRDIAIRHAETTMKNHVRPDFSSYHVVTYDTITGAPRYRQTAQGFSDNSTWARGQAWGIYGFTATYRDTKDKRFLKTAIGMADFFLKNKTLPKDKIPLWDFNVGQPGFIPTWNYDPTRFTEIPRDASAAAIASSALLELSEYVSKSKGKKYRKAAIDMIHSLSTPAYRAEPGTNNFFVLKRSVGALPMDNEINVPLVYADYYFLEALIRLKKLTK